MKKCLVLLSLTLLLTLPVYAGEGSFSVIYVPADDRPLQNQQMVLFADSLGVELKMPDSRDPLSWLLKQQGDCFIVSLDALLSGGLRPSRERSGDTAWEEGVILRLQAFAEGKEGYFFDSLLRLACNVDSVGELPQYYATLDYGRGVQGEVSGDYLAIRQRKLRLNLFAAKNLPGYLLGVDDSWAGETVQTGELEQLRQYLPENRIFSTFDGLPRVALAKLYLEQTGVRPGVRVRFFGDETLIPMHNYESPEEMTRKALSFFGLGAGDDLEILILTEIAQGKAAIKAARENQKRFLPTILINLCPRDEEFERAFLTLAPGQLLSYAGYGSSVNATHLGLSMGLARYAAMGHGQEHLRLLATILADEFGYGALAGEVMGEAGSLGLDPYDFRGKFTALEQFTLEKMKRQTEGVFSALERGGLLTGINPYEVSPVEKPTITGGYFPWHRCFEYHVLIGS